MHKNIITSFVGAKIFSDFRKASLLKKIQELYPEINDIDSRSKKNNEISELYGKGGLSISDTIAYENNLLLERNRKKYNYHC